MNNRRALAIQSVVVSTPVRVLALIILLWLVGVAFLGDAAPYGAVLAVPGLVMLSMAIRNVRKQRWDSAVAWAACSLVPLVFLAIPALTVIHLHEFMGGGLSCDAMAQNCNPQPVQALAHTVSLDAVLLATIATLWLLARMRRGGVVERMSNAP